VASSSGKVNLGCEFVALYLFDQFGQFLEAKIDNLGPRASLDNDAHHTVYTERLESLGDISFERVEVVPFTLEHFGLEFGLIAKLLEVDDDVWSVEMQPGNYMAFFEPWDSGEYET
jgi:hypothetical protein